MSHSAEWFKGAVAMFDTFSVLANSFPVQMAGYRRLLAAAEAREAGEPSAELAIDRAWEDGARFGWNCGHCGDTEKFEYAVSARREQMRVCASTADQPSAAAPRKHGTLSVALASGGKGKPLDYSDDADGTSAAEAKGTAAWLTDNHVRTKDGKLCCVEVRRPDTHGGLCCTWKMNDFDIQSEMDGCEVGEEIVLRYAELTDAEFTALGDFDGW